MDLRERPYLPLYVQDFMCDEKLAECSASATGVYIRILCLMHKQEQYGAIKLKPKDYVYSGDTETVDLYRSFALKLARYMPYDYDTIINGLHELIEENVLSFEGKCLSQKRMKNDYERFLEKQERGRRAYVKKSADTLFDNDECPPECPPECLPECTADCYAIIENEIENKNINNNDNIVVNVKPEIKRFNYEKVVEIYNSTCRSLPKKRKIAEQLKPKIVLRLSEMDNSVDTYRDLLGSMTGEATGLDIFKVTCEKAEASTFIKERGWFSFDWLMTNDHNWIKVIEGQYDDKHSTSGRDIAKETRHREMEQGFLNILNG